MSHWKIRVKILCSESWEGQNSMKAKIWGSKLYFFLVEPLVKILCSLKRGVKILYFFPVPWKRGGQNRGAYQPTSLKGCPPPPPPVLYCPLLSTKYCIKRLYEWNQTYLTHRPIVLNNLKADHHTGGTWSIHGTKHREANPFPVLKHPYRLYFTENVNLTRRGSMIWKVVIPKDDLLDHEYMYLKKI